jgi:hypothetical protein
MGVSPVSLHSEHQRGCPASLIAGARIAILLQLL